MKFSKFKLTLYQNNFGNLLKISKIRYLLFFLLLFSALTIRGQDIPADSLIRELDFISEDTSKVSYYNIIAKSYLRTDPKISLKYANKGLDLAKKLDYDCGIANLQKTIGNINYSTGNYEKAISNYVSSLEGFQNQKDTQNIANIYNNLAILYTEQQNYRVSRQYYEEALKLYKQIGDVFGQAAININLGLQYEEKEIYDTALLNYTHALTLAKELQDKSIETLALLNIGWLYKETDNYENAELNLRESLRIAEDINDNETRVNALIGLAEMEDSRGKHTRALNYLMEAEPLAGTLGLRPLLVDIYELKSSILQNSGDYKQALSYHQKYKMLEDSILTAEKDEALFNLQTLQEMELREKEIETLNAQNQINEQKLRASKFKNWIMIMFSGFTLILLLIVAYYFKARHKTTLRLSNQNRKISEQKQAIEEQKKELDKINLKLSELNSDLKSKNIRLRQLNKEKDYLMNVVAHDLKSPLNQINGLVNLVSLDKDTLNKDQQIYLEKIEMVSSRLSNMVNQMLDIEAIENQSHNLKLEKLDLRDILFQVIEDYERSAQKKDIKIINNINGRTAPVKVDRQHAHQVFANLVSNAIKFSPRHTQVSVNLIDKNNNVIAEIKDQGPGLNEEDKKKVFKKFSKLSAKPTGNEVSSGLGLSIVKKYVQAMNGKVWVDSEAGEGASFKVEFKKA